MGELGKIKLKKYMETFIVYYKALFLKLQAIAISLCMVIEVD
jgi:hypothetical protein